MNLKKHNKFTIWLGFISLILFTVGIVSADYSDLEVDATAASYNTTDDVLGVQGTVEFTENETIDFEFEVYRLESDGLYHLLVTLTPDNVNLFNVNCLSGICSADFQLAFENIVNVSSEDSYQGKVIVNHDDGTFSYEVYGDETDETFLIVGSSPGCTQGSCQPG
ncbi:MAG: hypothetical protein AAF490_18605 [Chloroflexota bacterium]